MSYEEISRHLGLSVWTVKNHHKQAVRALQLSLTVYPSERVRTTLACYILGLLDGGVPPIEVVERLKAAKELHPAITVPDGDAAKEVLVNEVADDPETDLPAGVTSFPSKHTLGEEAKIRASG
jgi:hypothetical protein